jgi:hypothetical protein
MREVLTVIWMFVALTFYLADAPAWTVCAWVVGGVLWSQIPRKRSGG